MSIPASPTPIRLKDALLSGNRDTRHCVYRCVDGDLSCQSLPAIQAAELLESGVYFQCPTKAVDAYKAILEGIIDGTFGEKPELELDPEPSVDKRSKEYREWKERNQKEDSE